ncbi:MAG: 2-oxoacid:acceptor oxidoreductase family protein [Dehalococcoidales bacterium]|nr:2-oxoacid:acceptor oxidoreductase family protein [Dehalococcoidales bacterium]
MTNKYEIRLCGYGGQGVILAGFIIGQAVSVYEKKHAIFIQDYGPEARGGACRADVIVANEPILYPYIDVPSALVAMSQEAYQKYLPKIRQDTVIIIDEDMVVPEKNSNLNLVMMPARKIAEELGRMAVANVVMLGFLTAVTNVVSVDAMQKSILASIPKGTEKLNMEAFERGYASARNSRAAR